MRRAGRRRVWGVWGEVKGGEGEGKCDIDKDSCVYVSLLSLSPTPRNFNGKAASVKLQIVTVKTIDWQLHLPFLQQPRAVARREAG